MRLKQVVTPADAPKKRERGFRAESKDLGSPPISLATKAVLREAQGRHKRNFSTLGFNQASRNVMPAGKISPDVVAVEPVLQDIRKADRHGTSKPAMQKVRRLRQVAKLEQFDMAKNSVEAKLRAKNIATLAATSCGACPGGLGLACAASLNKNVQDGPTVFGSIDNSTYSMATVRRFFPSPPS